MRLTLVTGPTSEPLTVDEARAHLRSPMDDDQYVAALIPAAREIFENETGRQLMAATYRLYLDGFPRHRTTPIELLRPPLYEVVRVRYRSNGAWVEWDEYLTDSFTGEAPMPGVLYPMSGSSYPSTDAGPDTVEIEYTCGYVGHDPDYDLYTKVPRSIRSTLLLMIGDLYEHRESKITGTMVTENRTLARLLNRYRLPVLA